MKAEVTLNSAQLAEAVALYLGARMNTKILAKNVEIIFTIHGQTKVNINIPDQGIASSIHIGSGGGGGSQNGNISAGGGCGINSGAIGCNLAEMTS